MEVAGGLGASLGLSRPEFESHEELNIGFLMESSSIKKAIGC
jgi:hypothetical protein